MILSITNAILPLWLLIIVGIVLQKVIPRQPQSSQLMCQIGLGSCDTWTSVLNKFALYLALPALIFSSLIETERTSLLSIELLFFSLFTLILIIIIVYSIATLCNLSTELKNTYVFGTFFGNVAYIGPPFLITLYGSHISGALSIIIAIHVALAFSIGLILLERSKHHNHVDWHLIFRTLLKNPLLIAVILGLLLLFSGWSLPSSLTAAIHMLGTSASPVVLIALGTFIAHEWNPNIDLRHTITITVLKLLGVPLLFLLVGVMLFSPSILRDVSILEAAMPVAISNFALAEQYPMNKKIIANAIILSTIFAIITLSIFSIKLA